MAWGACKKPSYFCLCFFFVWRRVLLMLSLFFSSIQLGSDSVQSHRMIPFCFGNALTRDIVPRGVR